MLFPSDLNFADDQPHATLFTRIVAILFIVVIAIILVMTFEPYWLQLHVAAYVAAHVAVRDITAIMQIQKVHSAYLFFSCG